MDNFDDNDNEFQELLAEANKSKSLIPWWQRTLLRFWPRMAFRYFASHTGADNNVLDSLHEAFVKTERIDLTPLTSSRGFMIIIDSKTSLWFYQDGDHFKYDGFEIGEYEPGDVTIFDHLKNQ